MRSRLAQALLQGSLDSLCGVYSVVNAAEICLGTGLPERQRTLLFSKLCDRLEDGRSLGEVVCEGIGFRKLGELIDSASRFLSKEHGKRLERRVASKEDSPSLGAFWKQVQENTGDGKAVLLGIDGKHSHWTVVEKATPKRLTLRDSDRLVFLDRSKCSVSASKPHVLWPSQTYFVQAVLADPEV